MRRIVVAATVSLMFAAHSASASDLLTSIEKAKDAVAADASKDPAPAADAKDDNAPPAKLATPPSGFPTGRIALTGLYANFAGFQAYDVYSTNKAISNGAREANPHMRALVENPLAFISLKVAVTAGPIYEAERLWRNNQKIAALALMAGSNGIMMVVAAHNRAVMNQPVIVR